MKNESFKRVIECDRLVWRRADENNLLFMETWFEYFIVKETFTLLSWKEFF